MLLAVEIFIFNFFAAETIVFPSFLIKSINWSRL